MHRVLCLVLSLCGLAAAAESEIRFTSGRILHGEVVSSDAERVIVKEVIAGKKGALTATITYKRADIASIVDVADVRADYARRAAAAPDGAGEQADLAVWCAEHGLHDEAIAHAQKAVASDPANAVATRVLTGAGMILVEGRWQDEAAYLARTGQERYDGSIMTVAEATARKEAARAKAGAAVDQQQADDLTARAAAIDKVITALRGRLAAIPKEAAAVEAQLATADTAKKRCDQLSADLTREEEAEALARRKADAVRTAGGVRPNVDTSAADRIRTSLGEAKRDLAKVQGDAPKLAAKKAALARDSEAATKKLAEQVAAQKRLQQELEDAKRAAAASAGAESGGTQPGPVGGGAP